MTFFLRVIVVSVIFFSYMISANSDISTNIVSLKYWYKNKSVVYDLNQTADKESGSLKFLDDKNSTAARPYPKYAIPVKAGDIYTISGKIRSDAYPLSALKIYGILTKNIEKFGKQLPSMYISNSKVNIWENFTFIIKVPDNSQDSKLYFGFSKENRIGHGNIWIDEITLKKGLILSERAKKKSFHSPQIRIDKLGNIKVHGKAFFPIMIYSDKNRDWSIYKKQGFNTIAWGRSINAMKRAKKVKMLLNIDVAQYISFPFLNQKPDRTLAHLVSDMLDIKDAGLMDRILFYYWDNEFYGYDPEIDQVVNIINRIDRIDNIQIHPHYMLSGHYPLARKYHKIMNLQGVYAARDITGEALIYNLKVLDHTENQNLPVVIGQFNVGINKKLRALVFSGIAQGMKGFGYWRDNIDKIDKKGRDRDVTRQAWWDDLPNISAEINIMLKTGLLQASHLSKFQVETDKPIDKIIVGTRLLKDEGYIIVGNVTDKKQKVIFTLKNLPYKVKNVVNYFKAHPSKSKYDNTVISKVIKDNKIEIILPSYGSRVILLKK